MKSMDPPRFQLRVSTLLGLVACVALNFWLFRLGPLMGILGLSVTKHVAVAYLCQVSGLNRRAGVPAPAPVPASLTPPLSIPHRPREDRGRALP